MKITPEKYLELICQVLAGMQAPGYFPTPESRSLTVKAAIATVDELLMQTGFSILE